MRHSLKKISLLIIYLCSVLILAGCQMLDAQKNNNESTDSLTVEPKYDQNEIAAFNNRKNSNQANRYENISINSKPILSKPTNLPDSLYYDSGIDIDYPESGVKGIYVTISNLADEEYFKELVQFVNDSGLNAMVIDFKDDHGNITTPLETDNPLIQENINAEVDLKEILKVLEANQIYPIARVVTFKDYLLSTDHPEFSFHNKTDGELWEDANGARFVNPFIKEVWEYNVDVAKEAAKIGFKEIQFDYIRFPEGFNVISDTLKYGRGDYENYPSDREGDERVAAITDFLQYAHEQLMPYGTQVAADIFGYTAVARDADDVRGIGQNFAKMSEQVDVISSMIYPSHWTPGFFGLDYPDLHPYEVVDLYLFEEKAVLEDVSNPVTSRPWLQDFTDYSLAEGTYQEYGTKQVQDQVDALYDHGIHEFLLWNIFGEYTSGVDYHLN